MYENRGQTGKADDVEIIGMIRNERVGELDAPMQEVVYVALLQAPRREIKLLVRTGASRPPRCRRSARPCGRSIHGSRWATCGRWRR